MRFCSTLEPRERAKLVLFYNPSASATRRGGPRPSVGSKRGRKHERKREKGGGRGRWRNPSGWLDGGGTAVN